MNRVSGGFLCYSKFSVAYQCSRHPPSPDIRHQQGQAKAQPQRCYILRKLRDTPYDLFLCYRFRTDRAVVTSLALTLNFADRHENWLRRGEDKEARRGALGVQGADGQVARRSWEGGPAQPCSNLASPLLVVHSCPKLTVFSQAAIQQRALRTLKQKRMYEGQLTTLQQQTWNMEQAAMTTENLKNTVSAV